MKDKYFMDTNIIVYLFDKTTKEKTKISKKLIKPGFAESIGYISYQVIQEFLCVASKKFKSQLSVTEQIKFLRNVLEPMCEVYPNIELFTDALDIFERWKYSFYDSLIIASALKANCNILYSEDLQHGQIIRDMKIVNPFLKEKK